MPVHRNWIETTVARGGDIYRKLRDKSRNRFANFRHIPCVCEGSRAQRFTRYSLMEADDKAA